MLDKIKQQIIQATKDKQKLQIIANESKVKKLNSIDTIIIKGYSGIVSYKPKELVITIKSGTSIKEVNYELNKNKQQLAFAPQDYNNSTIGGAYSCNSSGSSSAFFGSLRDFVLGLRIIDGTGVLLRFGGEVMKNVAGYDVARMLVGSRGGYGVIDSISFKVMPSIVTTTYKIPTNIGDSVAIMQSFIKTLPLVALAYYDCFLYAQTNNYLSTKHKQILNNYQAESCDCKVWLTFNPFNISAQNKKIIAKYCPNDTPLATDTIAIDWAGRKRYLLVDINNKESPDANQKNIIALEKRIKTVFDPHNIFHTS